jgi:hypothetical protein
MHNLQLTIPAQDGQGGGPRIRPREVRSWLDDLPFLDLQRAARLAREQLRLMNRQSIPAGTRLETLGDFLGTYQRLAEAFTGPAADNASLHRSVKHLCQDIGFGYKIVIHELVNKGGGFLSARHLQLALLGAIHSLGLQLADCYTAYQRAPRSLWSECLALYRYARHQEYAQYTASLPGFGEQRIDTCFRLIALVRLADPYALPASIVAPLRAYLEKNIGLSSIHSEPPTGRTSLPLHTALGRSAANEEAGLYLDIHDLLATMHTDIGRLEQHRQPTRVGLPGEVPLKALLRCLRQTLDRWRNQPERAADREDTHARVELVSGLDAAYCVANHGRRFDPSLFLGPDQDTIDLGAHPAPGFDGAVADAPERFLCSGINRSPGGLALRYRGAQTPHPRVGQLIALRRPGAQSAAGWVVAVCRWLIATDNGEGFELGLEYLARDPKPLVIRITDKHGQGGEYQAAIGANQKRAGQRIHTLITRSGGARSGALITIFEQGKRLQARCTEQLESGPGFERCIYEPV